MEKQTKAKLIVKKLKVRYGNPKSGLDYENSFQLVVAVTLSAQCTDKRVNVVTKQLFEKYNTPESILELGQEKLETYIYSTGFYKNKAKNIIQMCKQLIRDHNGEIPEDMDDLLKLSGIGRKSANVIRGHIFGKQGVVVDTHVKRLSNRFGLTKNSSPEKIERDMMGILDEKDWFLYSNLLIQHGRQMCTSQKPKCYECFLSELCDYKMRPRK